MSKSLADMTPEERDQCHGMWCDVVRHDKPSVLHDCFSPSPGQHGAGLYSPSDRSFFYSAAKNVTPRFDLPRAWNPDGTPPTGTWEYDTIEFQSYPEARGVTDRRWVSDWEEIE